MVKDILITSVLSDLKIGPKLYGVFSTGRLEELIEVIKINFKIFSIIYLPIFHLIEQAEPLATSDMFKPEIGKQVGELLAEFHSLEMPFVKQPDGIFELAEKLN